jgi:hypothetical protein
MLIMIDYVYISRKKLIRNLQGAVEGIIEVIIITDIIPKEID